MTTLESVENDVLDSGGLFYAQNATLDLLHVATMLEARTRRVKGYTGYSVEAVLWARMGYVQKAARRIVRLTCYHDASFILDRDMEMEALYLASHVLRYAAESVKIARDYTNDVDDPLIDLDWFTNLLDYAFNMHLAIESLVKATAFAIVLGNDARYTGECDWDVIND